ncbi:hypothetical protein LMTR13_27475 [Bradyrhizobium icense]|uniref:Uncharacterized protein n=1 Tax=Bradyrhizobium icense TaxID=1274631 RepID=A0A1B1UKS7_9BRAD|nr:hypothetical protein LMTR13_27475 [Bradyrhizobium icense]
MCGNGCAMRRYGCQMCGDCGACPGKSRRSAMRGNRGAVRCNRSEMRRNRGEVRGRSSLTDGL